MGGGRHMKRRDGHVTQGHARASLTAMWCANTSNFLPASRLERMNASSHPAADGRLSPPAQSSSPPSDAFDALARPTFSHSLWWSQKACLPFGRTARSSASLSSASARSSRHFAEIETGTICRARAGEASVSPRRGHDRSPGPHTRERGRRGAPAAASVGDRVRHPRSSSCVGPSAPRAGTRAARRSPRAPRPCSTARPCARRPWWRSIDRRTSPRR